MLGKCLLQKSAAGRSARGVTRQTRSAAHTTCPAGSVRGRHQDSRTLARAVPIDLGAIDFSNLTQEQLYAGGAILAAVLGLGAVAAASPIQGSDMADSRAAAGAAAEEAAPALPRKDAVLVLGGTGKLGRRVVEQLVRAGRTVVVAARSAAKAAEVLAEAGLQEGYQTAAAGSNGSSGILVVESGVDVTNPETLTQQLFEGVTQVVYALGPVAGRLPEGGFGYIDNMTPERVEAQGMPNILAAFKKHCPHVAAVGSVLRPGSVDTVLPMKSAADLQMWEKLDDVIMGGNSSSGLSATEDGSGAVWTGDLIVEGGGFCGSRTKPLQLDLSSYDGLQLRVKGDGQIFKFNIKTVDQEDTPESTYQATFDTSPDGDWTTVRLPWSSFVAVKRAQSDPAGAPLDPRGIRKFGLVLSRFEFNKMPNPSYKPGDFKLEIDGGICAYRAPRPAVVAVSSAGVERNAIIGDDAAARKRDIPIVQLNPGGVLNYKYDAECALRASGLPYTVIRCTGLDDKSITGPALLEADQGDSISGKVSRAEAAETVAAALGRADAAFKTFELRQSEAADAQGKTMSEAAFNRLFLKLALDRNRWRVGLQPFPRAVPPPPAPSEDRTKEILADPRVQAVRQRENANANQAASDSVPENVASARAWIANWRSKQGGQQGGNGSQQKVEQKERELAKANA